MHSGEQKPGFLVMALGLAAVMVLPFALTFPYSSLSHREIASELSSAGANDTRLFIAVVIAAVLIAGLPRQSAANPNSLKKVTLTLFIGSLAFVAMNAASFLLRGGLTLCAYGFPFVVREWGGSPNVLRDSFDRVAMWVDIVVALSASILLGAAQVRFVRQTPPLKRVAVMFSFALVLYIGVFSYWWLASKRMSVLEKGVTVRQVELHQTEVMYLTQPM